MKETQFIAQNKDKWISFEEKLQQKTIDPKDLKNLYLQVTDDLSYARTFYPNRSVRVYLNSLSKKVYNKIHQFKKSNSNRLLSFWTEELPLLVYESRRAFRLSFFVFVGSMLIGAFSSAMDPEFVRTILGDSYVEMTLGNIADGDPMRVYKDSKEMGMSVGITLNNLMVAFFTFLLGIAYIIGSIGILISNGVMVGSFQYFFYEQGFLLESFLTIWMHGTLEISAIIIAGAAGITMGRGLVFPGTFSRAKAFQVSAKRGLKIMIGITPIFIVAGFIEGYLTRHTDMPNGFRALFILTCLAFIVGYFVILPLYKKRKGKGVEEKRYKLQPDNQYQFAYYQIKDAGQLFNETFLFYGRNIGKLGLLFLLLSAIYMLSITLIMEVKINEIFIFDIDPLAKLGEIPQLFYNVNEKWLYPLNVVLYALVTVVVFYLFKNKLSQTDEVELIQNSPTFQLGKYAGILFISGLSIALLSFNSVITIFSAAMCIPFLLLWAYTTFRGEEHFFMALAETWKMYFANFSRVLGLTISFLLLATFFYTFIQSSLFWFLVEMIAWNLNMSQKNLDYSINLFLLFFSHFNMLLIYTLYIVSAGFTYFSLKEKSDSISLLKKIDKIGFDGYIRGIAKES